MHASIYNNGDYRVCCQCHLAKDNGVIRKPDNSIYNCRTSPVEETRNASLPKNIRAAMLAGKRHSDCLCCWQEEDAGITSRRQVEVERWKEQLSFTDAIKITQANGHLDEPPALQYWDIRFGNKCNLKCRMCWPGDSQLWYQDILALGQTWFYSNDMNLQVKGDARRKASIEDDPFNWHEENFFWQEIDKQSKDIQRIYIAGGEPLIIQRHYRFLNDLIENDFAKNIELEYATNITVLPQEVLSIWRNFKSVTLALSIDGVEHTNSYIRYPSVWAHIEKNVDRLLNASENIHLYINATVGVLNIYNLPELIDWVFSKKGKRSIDLVAHILCEPSYLSCQILPTEIKRQITERIEGKIDELELRFQSQPRLQHSLQNTQTCLQGILTYMNSADESQRLPDFFKRTSELDKIRSTSFASELPELFSLLS